MTDYALRVPWNGLEVDLLYRPGRMHLRPTIYVQEATVVDREAWERYFAETSAEDEALCIPPSDVDLDGWLADNAYPELLEAAREHLTPED